jgi:hypothetical protein
METIAPIILSELKVGAKIPYNDPRWLYVSLLKEGWELKECLQIDRNVWRVLIYYPKWNATKAYVLAPKDE